MQAVDILMSEHRLIERGLAILEALATRIESGEDIPQDTMSSLLDFFKRFADQCHHHKEEELLFPKLTELGIPFHNGPVEAMMQEHAQGRELMSKMSDALNAWGDRSAGSQFVQAARGYSDLLHHHIQREDQGVFMMAEGICTREDDCCLMNSFMRYESEKMGEGTTDRFQNLISQLELNFMTNP